MRHLIGVLCFVVATVVAFASPNAAAQTIEEARAAVAKAQAMVQPSSGSVRFERSVSNPATWALVVNGVGGGKPVAYSGTVTIVGNGANPPTVTFSPALWTSGAAGSDTLRASVEAVAAAAAKADKSVSVLEFDLASPMTRPGGAAPGPNEPLALVPMTVTTTTTGIPSVRGPGGQFLSVIPSTSYLMSHFWLNGGEVGTLFAGRSSPAQIAEIFRSAHARAFTDLGVPQKIADQLVTLRRAEKDDDTYRAEALAIFEVAGEDPSDEFVASLQQIGQPTNPNTRQVGDPGDIEIELEGTVCVEVQVPPFVKVSVCVKVKVKGKLKDIDALRRALNEVMEQVRKELEEKIRKQLEDLKKLLEDLLKEFRKWLEQLDLPWWLRYLSMGANGGVVSS